MINTHAYIYPDGTVERLLANGDAPVPDGLYLVELDTPVRAWPEAPFSGAVLIANAQDGKLSWRDSRTDIEREDAELQKIDLDAAQSAATGFVFDGKTFASDEDMQRRAVLMSLAASGSTGQFIRRVAATDGVEVTLGRNDCIRFAEALEAYLYGVEVSRLNRRQRVPRVPRVPRQV